MGEYGIRPARWTDNLLLHRDAVVAHRAAGDCPDVIFASHGSVAISSRVRSRVVVIGLALASHRRNKRLRQPRRRNP
jgi:hypothetical protein